MAYIYIESRSATAGTWYVCQPDSYGGYWSGISGKTKIIPYTRNANVFTVNGDTMTLTVKGNSLIKNTSELARKSTTAKPTPEQVKAGAAKTSDSASGSASLFDANGNLIIPDVKFLNALIEQGIDTNGDGKISKTEAEAATQLYTTANKHITNFSGIEAFINLATLNISVNNFSSINLGSKPKLWKLQIQGCDYLENFSTAQLPALENLQVWGGDKLCSLDVSKSPNLETLDCSRNPKLYAIKVSQSQLDAIPATWKKDTKATYTLDPSGPVPSFAIDSTDIIFGNVKAGKNKSKDLFITNNGTGDLVLSSCTISGANASDFSCTIATSITVPKNGGTYNLPVIFSPTTEGSGKSASLIIESNANNVSISLSGTCINGTSYENGKDYELSDGGKTLKKWLGSQTKVDMSKDPVLKELTAIGDYAFRGNTTVQEVIFGAKISDSGYNGFRDCSNLRKISLNEGLTRLGLFCFQNTALETITLPASFNWMNAEYGSEFAGCYKLKEIRVASGNTTFCSVNGIVYSKDMEEIWFYPQGKTETSFSTPSTVKKVSSGLFKKNNNLQSITLNEGIKQINYECFAEAKKLEHVSLPSTVTYMGASACDNLKVLKTLSSKAVEPPSVVAGSYNDTFRNTDLSKVTLYVPVGSKSKYQNADGWKDFGTIKEKSF